MKSLLMTIAYAVSLAFAVTPAAAGELSKSVRFDHSDVSLLAGPSSNGKWSAGVEIGLQPGWKTYWRVPGDAGVPPHFDWKASSNLDKVEIEWPAPKRYNDEAGESIGYKDHVVFPIVVTPKDPAKPVQLVLDLFYGICKEICIPASAKLAMKLTDPLGVPGDVALIEDYRSKVPSTGAGTVSVEKVGVENYQGALVLAVNLAGIKADARTDIFVEGSDEIYFRKPELAMVDTASKVYHLKIDGADTVDQLKGLDLTLTVVGEAGAISSRTTIK